MRPITFDWKSRPEHDLGLVAEEVRDVEPLLITRNDKGEVEGVKYEKLTVVLINAIKEQQKEISALRKLVCAEHPLAKVCKRPQARP